MALPAVLGPGHGCCYLAFLGAGLPRQRAASFHQGLVFLVILFLSVNLSGLWWWQPQCKTRGSKCEQPAQGNLLSQGSVFSGGSSGVLGSESPTYSFCMRRAFGETLGTVFWCLIEVQLSQQLSVSFPLM